MVESVHASVTIRKICFWLCLLWNVYLSLALCFQLSATTLFTEKQLFISKISLNSRYISKKLTFRSWLVVRQMWMFKFSHQFLLVVRIRVFFFFFKLCQLPMIVNEQIISNLSNFIVHFINFSSFGVSLWSVSTSNCLLGIHRFTHRSSKLQDLKNFQKVASMDALNRSLHQLSLLFKLKILFWKNAEELDDGHKYSLCF